MALSSVLASVFWCAFYGGGIIGSLVLYGLLQEKIMSGEYSGERFVTSVFLVFFNRIVAVIFAFFMALVKGESLWNVAPLWKYVAISVSNVFASTCQYEALKYVSFPVQMLGKSFKMMPVMLWGMAVGGKRYMVCDWIIAAVVTGGVTEFLLTGPISATTASKTSLFGLGLLGLFLVLDGFTSTYQEVLFKSYRTSKYNQMIYVNLGSCLVSSITVLATGGFTKAFAFIVAHPVFLTDVMLLSTSAVSAQWFIYSQVKEFGALVFAATMNVRQVLSILLSYVTYRHSVSALQVIGLCSVFGALFYQSAQGLMRSGRTVDEDDETEPLKKKQDKKHFPAPREQV